MVKDHFNEALGSRGLFFAPELSTSSRATIGGMADTDASGQGSCIHGKTRDHVLSLTTLLLDGTVWTVRRRMLWDSEGSGLAEALAHLPAEVRRLGCGGSSGAAGWFGA